MCDCEHCSQETRCKTCRTEMEVMVDPFGTEDYTQCPKCTGSVEGEDEGGVFYEFDDAYGNPVLTYRNHAGNKNPRFNHKPLITFEAPVADEDDDIPF